MPSYSSNEAIARAIGSICRDAAVTTVALLGLVGSAVAQNAAPPKAMQPAAPVAPSAAAGSDAALPDRITATFGDWTLRCERRRDAGSTEKLCELTQAIQRAGEAGALAQVAIGRAAAGNGLRITILVPLNVALSSAPRVIAEGKEGAVVQSTWSRCLSAGCLASAELPEDMLKKLQAGGEAARLAYRDAADRELSLPISLRGLAEARGALAKESAF